MKFKGIYVNDCQEKAIGGSKFLRNIRNNIKQNSSLVLQLFS